MNAIEDAIQDIGAGKMTVAEIIGVLEVVKINVHQEYILIPTIESL